MLHIANVKLEFVLQYSWSEDRLWRKNRRPGSPCDGVDLNRNYNDHWNEVTALVTIIKRVRATYIVYFEGW